MTRRHEFATLRRDVLDVLAWLGGKPGATAQDVVRRLHASNGARPDGRRVAGALQSLRHLRHVRGVHTVGKPIEWHLTPDGLEALALAIEVEPRFTDRHDPAELRARAASFPTAEPVLDPHRTRRHLRVV